jgi:hydroxyacylglutathione hydrolase
MSIISVYPLRVQKYWFINYCYLVTHIPTNDAILIDPAWEMDTIEKQLIDHNVTLRGILLTHSHPDHINLAEPLAIKYNVPVYMSRAEIDFYHFRCPNLNAIDNFTSFALGNLIINPLLTPGHTHGGTSYLIGDNLFCGDTIFIEGCGICTAKGGDPEALYDSLQIFKRTISSHAKIYPGHCYGHPVGQTFEFVLANNIYLQFDSKELFVKYRMRENQSNLFKFV